MIAIELRRSAKESLVILLTLLVLTLGLAVTDRDDYLAPIMEIFLLLYASFTGWAIFEAERHPGTMEYALGLPISRIKLLTLKLLPRIFMAALVLGAFALVHPDYRMSFLFQLPFFTIIYTAVFFLSFSLSLSLRSFIATFFLAVAAFAGLAVLLHWITFTRSSDSIAIQAGITLLLVPLLFFLFFSRFDLRPLAHFNRRYIPSLMVLLLTIAGLTLLFSRESWHFSYLTHSGLEFRSGGGKSVLARDSEIVHSFPEVLEPIVETGEYLVVFSGKDRSSSGKILFIHMENGRIETRFPVEKGYWVHPRLDRRCLRGQTVYLLLTSHDHKRYQVAAVNRNGLKIVPVTFPAADEALHELAAVVGMPERFLALSTGNRQSGGYVHVWQIDTSGKAEILFPANGLSVWNNRILRFHSSGISLYEWEGEDWIQLEHREGAYEKIEPRWGSHQQRIVLMRKGLQYVLFDLESGSGEVIPIPAIPYYYTAVAGDGIRFVWAGGEEISVSTWINGHFRVDHVWLTDLQGLKLIRVFDSGVVVSNTKRRQIFRFESKSGSSD